MGTIDFAPLWITLKTGIVASVFSFFIGIAFAELVINTKGRVRAFWDGTADTSDGIAAYRGWIHPFKDFQYKTSLWKFFKQ